MIQHKLPVALNSLIPMSFNKKGHSKKATPNFKRPSTRQKAAKAGAGSLLLHNFDILTLLLQNVVSQS